MSDDPARILMRSAEKNDRATWRRWVALTLTIFVAANLAVQFALAPHRFFFFFTTLSNTFATLIVSVYAFPRVRTLQPLRRQTMAAAAAEYLILVGLLYTLLLRKLWHSTGVDINLHYISPPAYLIFWAICVPKGALGWRDLLRWQIFPLLYGLLIVGVGRRFYPFLVWRNLPGLALLALAIGACLLTADRLLAHRWANESPDL